MDDGFSMIRFQGVQCSAEGRLWSEGQESRHREFSSFKVKGVWSRTAFIGQPYPSCNTIIFLGFSDGVSFEFEGMESHSVKVQVVYSHDSYDSEMFEIWPYRLYQVYFTERT